MLSDISNNTYTFRQALNYCQNLTEGGHSDWRLPEVQEVFRLVGQGGVVIANPNLGDWTWASGNPGGSTVTYIYYRLSDMAQNSGSFSSSFKVRCVR